MIRFRPMAVRAAGAALTLATVLVGVSVSLAETTAIKTGTLIDGTGRAPVKNAVVLVENGKITAVGKDVAVPAGATVIDLSSRTVLPGFIDAHVHLCGRTIGEGRDWENAQVRDLPQEDAIRGVRNARATLEAGFTTVRNVGADHLSDIALRDTIKDGVVTGPRILAAAHAIGITGGHCDTNGYNPGIADGTPETGVADGPDEIVKAVRLQVKRGADVIKFCATGGVLSEGDAPGVQQYSDDEMAVLVKEAHQTGRRVAAHAHGPEGIKAALRAGVDSIEHGSILDDEAIGLFKKTGAFLVPTLMAGEAVVEQAKAGVLKGDRAQKALYIAPKMRDSFSRAVKAGVNVALGTDSGVFPHGRNAHEFTLMVHYGMKPMDAIVAGTRGGATLLGIESQVGTVEAGRTADLVGVSGDPLQNIEILEKPVFVMHEGKVMVQDGGAVRRSDVQ